MQVVCWGNTKNAEQVMPLCKKRFQYVIKNSAIQNLVSQTLGIKSTALVLLLLPCAVYAQTGNIETGKPIHFYHQDWEVACDNTRTCRAVGYQADDSDSFPVSVLFIRKAGAGQNVRGEVKLGTTDYVEGQPESQSVQLIINNTSYGKIILNGEGLDGTLPNHQQLPLCVFI